MSNTTPINVPVSDPVHDQIHDPINDPTTLASPAALTPAVPPPSLAPQLLAAAHLLTHSWNSTPIPIGKTLANTIWLQLKHSYEQFLASIDSQAAAADRAFEVTAPDPTLEFLREKKRILIGAWKRISASHETFATLPQAYPSTTSVQPRIFVLADDFFTTTQGLWSREDFLLYIHQVQQHDPLLVREVWGLATALEIALVRRVLQHPPAADLTHLEQNLRSLELLDQITWAPFLEPLIPLEPILQRDPSGDYPRMDFTSRDGYRIRIEELAKRSACSESEIASALVALAHQALSQPVPDPRLQARRSHIGYYLLDAGFPQLASRIDFHPSISEHIRTFLRTHADEFYIGGVEVLTVLLIAAILLPLVPHHNPLGRLLIALLIMLIPASQTAVDVMNNIVTRLFRARALPKLDLSHGVPDSCVTLVAVPTLLISEKQVRKLVEDLEVTYLANQSANIHFALLTDLPDSISRPATNDSDPLVDLALQLITALNLKYATTPHGSFMLFHRHRVFNPRQGAWIGWERKRGKLLDLNRLLVGEGDSFPVKSPGLPDLSRIRYVITLDSDTKLPRGAAHRLIGALAHPLNQAVIDPRSRIVRSGYGILQPRVDISVHSAAHSRLASLHSGETGMDPYSRAASDAYQDLYGEGIFTGKGIYEVSTLHTVLHRRFPRNALLSHDLIEGAYARVGLASDIEVVDDYPSHYSAYTRRKHRWVRGDWQILPWLRRSVPNEDGKLVPNPISTVSRWKILDNLRRSLVETFTFILLLAGWLGLPGGPLYWTVVTLVLLFMPVYVQLLFALVPAIFSGKKRAILAAFSATVSSHVVVLLTLVFLPYQALVTLDAIVRAVIRRFVTGQRLLEWETAAQSELKTTTSTVDRYLQATTYLSFFLAIGTLLYSRTSLLVAAPILLLWALANRVSRWLNGKPAGRPYLPTRDEATFLRNVALRTWRYFSVFSTAENNWLIPDNVQQLDTPDSTPPHDHLRRAERLSPTNLGLLLNSRQAAVEFGYLTLPEFATLTTNTLNTVTRLQKHNGHIFNWYHNQNLEPIAPRMVSTVDSGNFAASLISLRMGIADLLRRPLLSPTLLDGLYDHLEVLRSLGHAVPAHSVPTSPSHPDTAWLETLFELQSSLNLNPAADADANPDILWWLERTRQRLDLVPTYIQTCLPWLLPVYAPLRSGPLAAFQPELLTTTPSNAFDLIARIEVALQNDLEATSSTTRDLSRQLLEQLPGAHASITALFSSLSTTADHVRDLVLAMDYAFLLNPDRELLSIGHSLETGAIEPACYDLLASEARIAAFLAIAKGDIPQQSWFRLGRLKAVSDGKPVLLSWTGTMFEYLMPTLWIQDYPNTLMFRTLTGVVQIQRNFTRRYRIPWGISESAYAQTDSDGNYMYLAFGIPEIGLKYGSEAGPVISPYSSCLALGVDPKEPLQNLKTLQKMGWLSSYGFYEAGDYSAPSASRRQPECLLVRSWMAHHQGMSLLAICNLLNNNIFRTWFHASPMVQSTERLLHERPGEATAS
jgi:hypothetical protein